MNKSNSKSVVIVTHNGNFHTDDVFAVAAYQIYLEGKGQTHSVVRTRDTEVINEADIVVDVGGIYDPSLGRFDHHQIGGAGERDGVPYSSFGLIWKQYGQELCGDIHVWKRIDRKLAYAIDSVDSGMDTYAKVTDVVTPYLLQNVTTLMKPTWKEESGGKSLDAAFTDAVVFARMVIQREITQHRDVLEGEKFVHEAYKNTDDKRIIVLDGQFPWEGVLSHYAEPLFVVKPNQQSNDWRIKAVRSNPSTSFANRKDFPSDWGGLVNEELAKVSGVKDASFCHRALFNAGATSKEGAMELARLAVEK